MCASFPRERFDLLLIHAILIPQNAKNRVLASISYTFANFLKLFTNF